MNIEAPSKIEQVVTQLFGSRALQYLQNKRRGGDSNDKGNAYELHYAVYELTKLATEFFENAVNAKIESQTLTFVDDLVVTWGSDTAKEKKSHSQLKNTQGLKWGSLEEVGSLAFDFLSQKRLNDSLKIETKGLVLVTSQSEVARDLKANMPTDIKSFSQVLDFSPDTVSQALEYTEHRENLKMICPFDEIDKLEAVHATIMGAWISMGKSCFVSDLIAKARTSNPCYIRPEDDGILDPKCEQLLNAIPKFEFSIEGGFFSWTYGNGLEEGVFSENNLSERFAKFQQWIISKQPKTFEDIEGALL